MARRFYFIPAEKFEDNGPFEIDHCGGDRVSFPQEMLVGPFLSAVRACRAVPVHKEWGREALILVKTRRGLRVWARLSWPRAIVLGLHTSPLKGMRLRAKLLTAATLFDPSQMSTTDVTKLTVGDLNYLNSHWRNGSMDGEFMRAKLVALVDRVPSKSWPVTDLRRYPVARYMVLCKGDVLDGDAEGMIGYIEVEARKDGYMTAAPDYKSYKGFPTYEEAVMEFATHGLE